ncbi:MAG: hypothetical protein Q7W13_17505 [Bacteroidia bacterium]|nr:hypothetical protein [Bacteroidia bacterium]
MNTVKLNRALNASPPLLRKGRLLGLLFFLFTQISFAQPRNDKQVFDLNDPRNPDCPCHKYQKMADDEFEQINKKKKLDEALDLAELGDDHKLNRIEIQSKDSKKKSHPAHSNNSKKKKRKTVKRSVNNHINLFSLRSFKTKRFKPTYSVCFKW